MNRNNLCLLAIVVLAWPFSPAAADPSCTFGSPGFVTSYDSGAASVIQSQVTVTCQRNLAGDPTSITYSIAADNGLYPGGGSNRANLAGNLVSYDVYRDSGCGAQWRNPLNTRLPDPAPGTMTLTGFIPTTAVINYWGCVPAGQAGASSGIHTDTVGMTLRWRWAPGGGNADSATASFGVEIHVDATCSISTPPGDITFSYTSFGAAANAGTTFGATCTNLLPYTLALDTTGGTLLGLNYALALSAAGGTGNGLEQTYSISGTMAAGQIGTCAAATCSASQPHTLIITY